jgi:hypothetical protein
MPTEKKEEKPDKTEEQQETKRAAIVCGAKDLHNTNGKDNICILKKGHDGLHFDGKYGFSEAAVNTPLPKDVQEKLDARPKKEEEKK